MMLIRQCYIFLDRYRLRRCLLLGMDMKLELYVSFTEKEDLSIGMLVTLLVANGRRQLPTNRILLTGVQVEQP